MDRQALGRVGEAAAVELLLRRGYTIVARNFRTSFGEIDLIAEHRGTTVFVEVKTRTTDAYGAPFDAVTPLKQRRLTRLATYYLKGRQRLNAPARFDAVAATVTPDGHVERVDLLVNAFDAID